jgi:hypothetical protein
MPLAKVPFTIGSERTGTRMGKIMGICTIFRNASICIYEILDYCQGWLKTGLLRRGLETSTKICV